MFLMRRVAPLLKQVHIGSFWIGVQIALDGRPAGFLAGIGHACVQDLRDEF